MEMKVEEAKMDIEAGWRLIRASAIAAYQENVSFQVRFFEPTNKDKNTVQVTLHVEKNVGTAFCQGTGETLSLALMALAANLLGKLEGDVTSEASASRSLVQASTERQSRLIIAMGIINTGGQGG